LPPESTQDGFTCTSNPFGRQKALESDQTARVKGLLLTGGDHLKSQDIDLRGGPRAAQRLAAKLRPAWSLPWAVHPGEA
jgi:hypothetical protein